MNCRRRIVFKAAMIGMLSPYLFEQARAQSKEKTAKSSPLEDNKAKREFIERARTQWKQDYAAILLSAKEDQRRGVLQAFRLRASSSRSKTGTTTMSKGVVRCGFQIRDSLIRA